MAPKRKAEDAPAATLSTYPQLFGTSRNDAGDMALETIHEMNVARTAELQTRIESIQAKIDEVKPALDDAAGSEQSEATKTLLGISKEVADLLAELCEQSMEMSDVSESFNGVIAELDNLSLSTTSMLEAQATARESYAASKTAEASAERIKQTAESFSIAERAVNKHMNSTDTSVRDLVARYQKAQRDLKNLLPQKAKELSQALSNMAEINENLRPLRQATEVMRDLEQLKIRARDKGDDADEDDESAETEIEEEEIGDGDSEDDGLDIADEFELELYTESEVTRRIKDSLGI
jgi:chromosome segregation ATPase